MEWKNESDNSNNGDIWSHVKIGLKIPEQNTGKARNLGTTENSHIGHCTYNVESANVKVQNIFNMASNITCSRNCKYRTAATLYTLVT